MINVPGKQPVKTEAHKVTNLAELWRQGGSR
jgi:hypothetical protein